ncbi:bifunctional folylpolyglutamate synthase/dihydrofolate synthase [Botrimarina hoheduenensis]|uniref:bifunctional folylpolyglutamate synthase/dihydrofolate synthase n=1 Tax=Botrimarina hoheduenensis TaxID=2528000 RepID=UPI0018D317E2|nr:folylpolyglutamate synthase/dihydrofolate synthase family protein [Botrimarina hoheduenensis]
MKLPPYASRRDEAIAWLYSRINYETSTPIPYSEQGLKLERMRELAARLGNPQDRLRIVHVAGTKGKGSTGAMIAAALRASGQRVGVYSSPHFDRLEERFAIDGQPCCAEALVRLVSGVREAAEAMDASAAGPTFFDLTTAMALQHFADHAVDWAVIEVGLGGRLDSTNIVTPEVAVITSISFDHTRQLGNTLALIAAEKAGIIKPTIPIVSGVVQAEPAAVIRQIAGERSAPLLQRNRDFHLERRGDAWSYRGLTGTGDIELIEPVRPLLPGFAQAENAATALATLGLLAEHDSRITPAARSAGVATARLPGRLERFPGEPLVVIDGAHNDASVAALVDALDALCAGIPAERRVLMIAIAADKDVGAVLAPLVQRFSQIVATRFVDNPRALAPGALENKVREIAGDGVACQTAADPAAAYKLATRLAGRAGAVVGTGSLLFAAEARRLVVAERGAPP